MDVQERSESKAPLVADFDTLCSSQARTSAPSAVRNILAGADEGVVAEGGNKVERL